MATGPKLGTTPLEVLTPDLTREEPFLNKLWGPALCGTSMFLAVCFGNFVTHRPVFSGIQKHAVLTAGAAWFGQWIDDYRKYYYAEKDAVLRHYIELHPEDFPPFERKKYSDLLEPWVPIR